MPAKDALRVALAGVHRQIDSKLGGHNWASAFAEVPETAVVAISDGDAGTRQQFQETWRDVWGDVDGYDDYGEMLEKVKPDIVCIATRQTYHADQIDAAIAAGVRGLVCEKPLCTTLEEMDRIVAALRTSRVPFAFGLELRWSESYNEVFRLLRDGVIGDVTSVVSHGVSELINHGCHFFDVALGMAGDPEPVSAAGLIDDPSQWDDWRRGDPHGRGWVALDNGVNLGIMSEGGRRSYTITGTAGRLVVMQEGERAYLWGTDDESGEFASAPVELDVPRPDHPWHRGPAAIRDLAGKVKNDGRTACDVEETRRATEIGFAIHASAALGGAEVSFPVQNRTIRVDSRPWGNDD